MQSLRKKVEWMLVVIALLGAQQTRAGQDPSSEPGIPIALSKASAEDASRKPVPPRSMKSDWSLGTALVAGCLDSESHFSVKVPVEGTSGYKARLPLGGESWGGGLRLSGHYKAFSFENLLFTSPSTSEPRVISDTAHLGLTVTTGLALEPYFGLGLGYTGNARNLDDFMYSAKGQNPEGISISGKAKLDTLTLSTHRLDASPELGLQLKLPLRDWSVRTYYQFVFRYFQASTSTPGGSVSLYAEDTQFLLAEMPIEGFDKQNRILYLSHVAGLGFSLALSRSLSFQGDVTYDVPQKLLNARASGLLRLSQHVGFTASYEFQDMILFKNTQYLIGLTFLSGHG